MKKVSAIWILLVCAASLAFAQRQERVPSYAVGTFSGYSDWQKLDLELTITSDSKISFTKRNDRGDRKDYPSYWRDGAMHVGNVTYYLRAVSGGLRLENKNEDRDSITLRRGSLPPFKDPRENRVPNYENAGRFEGTFSGRNDYKKADFTITIRRDGSAQMTQRLGPNSNSWKGELRGDLLDFDWVEYRVRRSGDGIEIQNVKNDRDRAFLRRTDGGPDWGNPGPLPGNYNLRIDSPRNNDQFSTGDVRFDGTSNAPEVRVELSMPNGRKQSRIDRTDRDGRWQISFNRLESGRYSVEVSGIRDGKVVSRQNLSFTVQDRNSVKRGEITLDTPMNRGTYRPGNVEFSGSSNGDTVRIEVYRGRDRVYTGQVSSRDGRFSSRVSLGVGSYQVTISNIRDDRVIATKKISFSVN